MLNRPPLAERTDEVGFLEWYPRLGTALTLTLLVAIGIGLGVAFGVVATHVISLVVGELGDF